MPIRLLMLQAGQISQRLSVTASLFFCTALLLCACALMPAFAAPKPEYQPLPPDAPSAATPISPISETAPPPQSPPKLEPPPLDVSRYQQMGNASWYAGTNHGKRTANGDIYDIYELTAAHQTLPLGAQVRVTHVGNGRSVVVLINDRLLSSPSSDPASTIQLSFYAAKLLGLLTQPDSRIEIRGLTR